MRNRATCCEIDLETTSRRQHFETISSVASFKPTRGETRSNCCDTNATCCKIMQHIANSCETLNVTKSCNSLAWSDNLIRFAVLSICSLYVTVLQHNMDGSSLLSTWFCLYLSKSATSKFGECILLLNDDRVLE